MGLWKREIVVMAVATVHYHRYFIENEIQLSSTSSALSSSSSSSSSSSGSSNKSRWLTREDRMV